MYAQVNKPKLTDLAANLNNEAAFPSSGLLDLEQEVKNIQMVRELKETWMQFAHSYLLKPHVFNFIFIHQIFILI